MRWTNNLDVVDSNPGSEESLGANIDIDVSTPYHTFDHLEPVGKDGYLLSRGFAFRVSQISAEHLDRSVTAVLPQTSDQPRFDLGGKFPLHDLQFGPLRFRCQQRQSSACSF